MKKLNSKKLNKTAARKTRKDERRENTQAIKDLRKMIRKSAKAGNTSYSKRLNGHWQGTPKYHVALRWMRRYGGVDLVLREEYSEDHLGAECFYDIDYIYFKFSW